LSICGLSTVAKLSAVIGPITPDNLASTLKPEIEKAMAK